MPSGNLAILIIFLRLCSGIPQGIVFPPVSSGPEQCRTTEGKQGECAEFRTCIPVIKNLVEKGVYPKQCGFKENIPIVCCPPIPRKNMTGSLTRLDEVSPPLTDSICGFRGFIEYDPRFVSGGLRKKRSSLGINVFSVAGGVHAFRNSWPWMALLGRKRGPDQDFFCSAILINENYVLTAAHCVLAIEPIFVRFGEHDYGPNVGNNLFELIEDIDIDDVIFHPSFEPSIGYHDTALLKLARNISFRSEVSPICLPWGTLIKDRILERQVVLTGWGKESFDGQPSTILQEVNLTVFQPSVCELSYSTLRDFRDNFPQGLNQGNIVCAGDAAGGKDACEGDSGGPIMRHDEDDTYILVGIVSKGFGCGKKDFPGLYAPIQNLETLEWIKRIAF